MDIASMVDLIDMIKHLDEENERISDWVFPSDGKSIVIDLTSGESYRFSVGQEAKMMNLMEKKNYDLTQITRVLLEIRDNCVPKDGEAYDDPKRMEKYDALKAAIDLINNPSQLVTGDTSDGYHTFNELYHHRAVLFSVIVKAFPDKAWKSKQHNDGTMYDGMFIVGIDTPEGQATYHYDIDPYWDIFECYELARAPKWDGHTPAQAIERIGRLEPVRRGVQEGEHVREF